MAVNSYYVDPSIAADSGAGTSGDPYGDLQYALDNITHDGANGDRINIKAGTAEVLAAALDFTTFGQVNLSGGLTFAGYTTAEGDGGIGEIDGNALYHIIDFDTNKQSIQFYDLKMGNCGASNGILHMYRGIYLNNCELHTAGGHGIEVSNYDLTCVSCHFHNIGGNGVDGISSGGGVNLFDCFFEDGGTYQFSPEAVFNANCFGCVFYNYTSSYGVNIINRPDVVMNCSFFPGGTKASVGVRASSTGLYRNMPVYNLFENCSVGIDSPYTTFATNGLIGNAFYDCTTNHDSPYGDGGLFLDNESLGASPFAKSGSATFANRATYFAPVDTGNVFTGGLGGGAKGAVQPVAAGGGLLRVGMSGGIFG